jgi:hypothetical protein
MKKNYIVSCDLGHERDYSPFIDEMARFEAVQLLSKMWVLHVEGTDTRKLLTHFRRFLQKEDRLVVIASEDWESMNSLIFQARIKIVTA